MRFDDGFLWSPRTVALLPQGQDGLAPELHVAALSSAASPGWRADDAALPSTVVDGWRQGWLVQTGQSVTGVWWPTEILRPGLVAGAAALLLVLIGGSVRQARPFNRTRRRTDQVLAIGEDVSG